MTHVGYRCPNADCPGKSTVYRSALADAQALPGFSFGLDIVALVGHLKLNQHQTVDEVHRDVNERLKNYQISMSRRNVMYLFEAYSALLKAAAQNTSDPVFQDWLGQVRLDGGFILSIDGIQPDKGNETIYLVREVSTGRLLSAQNVTTSDTETIKQVFSPVLALGIPVIGIISDAQKSLIDAISALWPDVPHQTCQFHYLQEAARPIFEVDRGIRAKMRKNLTEKLRPLRPQIERRIQSIAQEETEESRIERGQLHIISDYVGAAQSSLHVNGKLPFDYPGLKGYQSLDALDQSLEHVKKE
jgi:Transposase, Mutator family